MFRVYIDEADDRGHHPASSTHFVVSAVVVRDAYDAVVRGQLTTLRTALGRQPGHTLHFRKLTHSQKVKASQDAAAFSIDTITNVIMVKPRFAGATPAGGTAFIKHADPMYLYAVRLLLERVSWYVDENGGGPAIINFAHLTRRQAAQLPPGAAAVRDADPLERLPGPPVADQPPGVRAARGPAGGSPQPTSTHGIWRLCGEFAHDG